MACGLMLAVSGQAVAGTYCFQYSGTINTISAPFTPSIANGDAAKIIVKLDNGGASLNSQTWTSAHLQSITFDFKNGTFKTTFNAPFNSGLTTSSGSFATNSSGVLTSVMTNWQDTSVGTDFTTNGTGDTPDSWYIDGSSATVYVEQNRTIDFTTPANITVASNWSNLSCPSSSSGAVSAPIDLTLEKQPTTFASEIEVK